MKKELVWGVGGIMNRVDQACIEWNITQILSSHILPNRSVRLGNPNIIPERSVWTPAVSQIEFSLP